MTASNDASNDSADLKPDLKVVEPEAAATADEAAETPETPEAAVPPPPEVAPTETPPARSRMPWLLGIALFFALVFALVQGHRADRLSEQVDLLEAELEIVGVELAAQRGHLARVRVGIDDLASRAQALSDLAHAQPGGATAEGEGAPVDDGALPEAAELDAVPDAVDF